MLRPLRSITRIPGMRTVVSAFIDSIPHLINVTCVLMIFILVFGILGMQMFSGLLYNRCRITETPEETGVWLINESNEKLCGYKNCLQYKKYKIILFYNEKPYFFFVRVFLSDLLTKSIFIKNIV